MEFAILKMVIAFAIKDTKGKIALSKFLMINVRIKIAIMVNVTQNQVNVYVMMDLQDQIAEHQQHPLTYVNL